MAKRPIVFAPELVVPVGINNYPGTVFKCFTRGTTLPFTFTLSKAGVTDYTGWQVKVIISDILATDDKTAQDQTQIEVTIPLTDAEGGVFSGTVTDTETNTLKEGINVAEARFIDDTGQSFIIDMCKLEVYPSTTYTND